MPTNEFGDTIQASATGKNEFGDTIESGANGTPSGQGIAHEYWRQLGIPDLIKGLRENPVGTITSALGGLLSLIKPGLTPVPERGGHISVTEPTQGENIQDVMNRGPEAITGTALAGLTQAGLGAATKLPVSRVPAAVGAGVKAAAPGLTRAAGNIAAGAALGEMLPEGILPGPAGSALRYVAAGAPIYRGARQIGPALGKGLKAARAALSPTQEAAIVTPVGNVPSIDPELQAMRDDIAKGFKYKDFASVTNPTDRATIQDLASRINSGAAPLPAAAGARPGPQLVPRVTPSGQDVVRGSSNIPLSGQGYAEAHRLADATAGQWDEIHTSPLDRAQETAQIIADVNPQAGPVKPTEALTPWYLGQHEGQPTTAVLDKMQDLIQKPDEVPAGRGPQSTKPGQSFNNFKNEFLGHVKDQVDAYQPGQKILNATHYRDTRVLQAWANAGAPDDLSVDVPTMLQKGAVKPGDMLRLDPKTMQVEAVRDASKPGIYFARHGATEWNAENGTVNPAESAGAPGPRGPAATPPAVPQVPPEQLARLNAGAPPAPAPAETGMFLRNYDLDKIARTVRTQLNRGTITKSQAQQIIRGNPAGLENLRDQLGLKGRFGPGMADYLAKKVF